MKIDICFWIFDIGEINSEEAKANILFYDAVDYGRRWYKMRLLHSMNDSGLLVLEDQQDILTFIDPVTEWLSFLWVDEFYIAWYTSEQNDLKCWWYTSRRNTSYSDESTQLLFSFTCCYVSSSILF